jgi:hypothetical protein
MLTAAGVDNHHLLHQSLMIEVRITPGDLGIVQREKRQSAGGIPAMEPFHLPLAKSAMAIVDNDLGARPLQNGRKFYHVRF